jgi:hypothetical protein
MARSPDSAPALRLGFMPTTIVTCRSSPSYVLAYEPRISPFDQLTAEPMVKQTSG